MSGAGAQFKVIKNRSPNCTWHRCGRRGWDLFLEPTGIAYSQDLTAAAKVAADYAKTNDKFVIVGGLLGKQALSADGVKALAAIPSMEELRSRLLGVLLALAPSLRGSLTRLRRALRECCRHTRKSKKRRDGSRQSLQSPIGYKHSRGLNV